VIAGGSKGVPVDLSNISSNLVRHGNGLWVARDQRDVSYPPDGNEKSYAVEDSSFWFRHRNQVITALVSCFSPCKTFFDIGGGNGCVAHALQLQGNSVVLVEPGASGARNAIQRGVSTVVQSTLEDAGFSRESMPSVGLFDVMEHIESDGEFLQCIHYFLRAEGHLYVTVPAYQGLWSVDDIQAGHFRRYSAASLRSRLNDSGFDVLYCGYLFSILVPAVFFFRSLPTRLGVRKVVSDSTIRSDHSTGTGMTAAVVNRFLTWELNQIRAQKRIPFGSSCLAVARKRH
jgi:SAM-dependent methyltransferase